MFVGNALNPAKISRVSVVDDANRRLEITVDDSQLSQAIGKKGQNVRLASQLVGWNIDIKSESEKKREIEDEMARVQRGTRELKALPGVGEKTIQKLLDTGYRSLEDLVEAGVAVLCSVEGVGEKTAQKIVEAATEAIARRQELEAEAHAAAEEARLIEEARLAAASDEPVETEPSMEGTATDLEAPGADDESALDADTEEQREPTVTE